MCQKAVAAAGLADSHLFSPLSLKKQSVLFYQRFPVLFFVLSFKSQRLMPFTELANLLSVNAVRSAGE